MTAQSCSTPAGSTGATTKSGRTPTTGGTGSGYGSGSSVRSRPGPPWGPVGGLPRARDETGRQNVVRPRLSFLLVGQL